MNNLTNLAFQQQMVMITGILLIMYFIAIVPKTLELFKYVVKNKSFAKKMLYFVFFLISFVADVSIMVLAIHGLVYFLKS